MHLRPFSLILLFFSVALKAQAKTTPHLEESLYQSYQTSILSRETQNGFFPLEESLYVDALWDLLDEKNSAAQEVLKSAPEYSFNLIEKFRIALLRLIHLDLPIPESILEEVISALQAPEVEFRLIYLVASYEKELVEAREIALVNLAKLHPQYGKLNPEGLTAPELIAHLVYETPDTSTYMNGEYAQSVKIFMFCRENRLYPCLMIMKNSAGQLIREDGQLWHHKALGSSARGLPSYYRNGNTPTGIFTIDSVMPFADQNLSYGKFRRMILNFVPPSNNEVLFKSLLPPSSHDQDWWKASIIARDAGRNLFRIHGTGRINTDPLTPYYPFSRTNGCIAQRENTYEGITYKDQRDLLDAIMSALNLVPAFEHEPRIKGILYIMEIDDKNAPVELADLLPAGIE